ncbi:unnamed protein product [Didymodactylos carnosus]|uniref:Uncharacterized protein n=1 Tax=Didymodactylos carnosus TaxID=1234261 RepID=A0A8S2KEH8_9BILA|nr:unnamed protein product [Didymodactylos carnosus]CAF3838211.1 unnamed protein product [Didymodactylos carnosus]
MEEADSDDVTSPTSALIHKVRHPVYLEQQTVRSNDKKKHCPGSPISRAISRSEYTLYHERGMTENLYPDRDISAKQFGKNHFRKNRGVIAEKRT